MVFYYNGTCSVLTFLFTFLDMLQEKASAVADEDVTVAQSGELATDSSHLGLPVAPSIHHSNEVDQVKQCLTFGHSLETAFLRK